MPGGAALDFQGTDRFQINRRLGAGGMGVVYEAVDRERDTRVALKTLRELDPQLLYLLKNEFRALQDLSHPNLVALGDLIEADGQWFYTMELIDGVEFLDYVRTEPLDNDAVMSDLEASETQLALPTPRRAVTPPPVVRSRSGGTGFDEKQLRAALAGLVTGLNALHEAGKVHRDVKSSNVLVARDGRVVLVDFGLVIERAAELSRSGQVVGTAAYMAPEQAASKRVGPAADWYSVGVLLYEALTGRFPFSGSYLQMLMRKQEEEPEPPSALVPGVPADLDELCVALLHFDPEQRPTGPELMQKLGVHAAPSPPSTTQASGARLFVGREDELAQIDDAFACSLGGASTAVYVHGESGIGKSRLIRRWVDTLEAERPDAIVLHGRCYEREQVPYKALDGVIDALSRELRRLPAGEVQAFLPRRASLLPTLFPVLGMVEEISQAPQAKQLEQDPSQLRASVFAALRELFQRLTDRHPVVVVIDDFQWADADSHVLLTDLLRPPDAPPLLLLVSSLAAPEGSYVASLSAAKLRPIELEPLPPGTARVLTRKLLAQAGVSAAESASLISIDAHGHPLFIDELVRHVALTGTATTQGQRLDEAIWHRASQLPADARRLLELVAIAVGPLHYDVFAHASQLDAGDFGKRMSLLRAANLVRRTSGSAERFEPYHNRVRLAVLRNLDEATAHDHHVRLSVALESAAPGSVRPEQLLHHLERADQTDKAAEYADLAARAASSALAFDQAAELYATALRVGSYAPAKRNRVLLARAEALANAGRGAEAADAYLEAAESVDPVTRRECQRHAAQQLLVTGHLERGVDTLAALLRDADADLPSSPRKALAALLRQRLALRLRGLRFTPKHEREIADADLTRLDVYQVVGDGLAMVDNISGALFQTRSLRLALRLGETRRIAHAIGMEAIFLGSQGGRALRRARKLVDQLRDIADGSDDPLIRAYATAGEGVWCYLSGEFERASELLGESVRMLRDQTVGTQMELNNTRLFHLFCLRHLGWLAESTQLFDVYVRDAERRGDLYAATTFRRSCGRIWLARDDPEGGRADLERATWTPPEKGFHFQHWYELEALVELALYEGRAEEWFDDLQARFEALQASLLPRIQIVRTAGAWLWGRLYLGTAADPARADQALPAVSRLARKLRHESLRAARVWGSLLDGGVLASRGDTDAARDTFARALPAAEESQMHLVAAVTRRRLGELTGGDDGAALIEAADAWMREQGIRAPARFSEMVAPLGAHR